MSIFVETTNLCLFLFTLFMITYIIKKSKLILNLTQILYRCWSNTETKPYMKTKKVDKI